MTRARSGAPPGKQDGRPGGQTPEPADHLTTSAHHDASTSEATGPPRHLVAVAVAYPPAARRTRWLTIVTSCPHEDCGLAHHHYGDEHAPARGAYRAGCGRVYWIAAAVVSPHTGRVVA